MNRDQATALLRRHNTAMIENLNRVGFPSLAAQDQEQRLREQIISAMMAEGATSREEKRVMKPKQCVWQVGDAKVTAVRGVVPQLIVSGSIDMRNFQGRFDERLAADLAEAVTSAGAWLQEDYDAEGKPKK